MTAGLDEVTAVEDEDKVTAGGDGWRPAGTSGAAAGSYGHGRHGGRQGRAQAGLDADDVGLAVEDDGRGGEEPADEVRGEHRGELVGREAPRAPVQRGGEVRHPVPPALARRPRATRPAGAARPERGGVEVGARRRRQGPTWRGRRLPGGGLARAEEAGPRGERPAGRSSGASDGEVGVPDSGMRGWCGSSSGGR